MNKLDTILFDLDGTLIDSNGLIIDSFKYVFNEALPFVKLTDADYQSFIGPTLWASFSKYEKDKDKVDELVLLYRRHNNAHHDSVLAFDGALSLLKNLKEKGYKVGVVSSKMRYLVLRGLEITGLMPYVDVVVGMDEVENHKPNPESLLLAMKLVKGKYGMYVGDHPADILAGKNASMLTCGVGYSWHKTLKDVGPDYMINHLMELLQLLEDYYV